METHRGAARHSTGASLLLLGLALLQPGALPAQGADSAYASAALDRLASRLAADTSLPDSLRHLSPADLIAKDAMNAMPRLPDEGVVRFMRLMAASMHALPEPTCGSLLMAGNQRGSDPEEMLFQLPPPLADEWIALLEQLVHARANRQPYGRIATAEEMHAWNMGLPDRLEPERRDRLIRIAQNPPPTQADACWAMRLIMDDLAAAPPATIGPITRAMFGR